MSPWVIRFMSIWPPYLGAGIRIKKIAPDYSMIEVQMNLHFWNRNYVGTHFGGSIYSMTDPFYMLMLIQILGKDYIVWDKAAHVHFKKPGTGPITARFELSAEQIESIRRQADTEAKAEPIFTVEVKDKTGDVVALIEKVVYVSTKEKFKERQNQKSSTT